MAAHTVSVDDLTSMVGQADRHGIITCRFVDQIIDAGFCFVGNLADDMRVREMTFRAGVLMMIGCFPLMMDGIHAVTGSAKSGIARLMISSDSNGRKDDPNGDAGN